MARSLTKFRACRARWRRARLQRYAALSFATLAAGCSSVGGGGTSDPLYSGGLGRVDARLAALEESADRLDRETRVQADKIDGLDAAVAGVRRTVAEGDAQLEAAVATAADGDRRLAVQLTAVDRRLDSLSRRIAEIAERLDRVEKAAAGAAEEAVAVRDMVNRMEAERMEREGSSAANLDNTQVYGLHLASYRSLEGAGEGWRALRAEYPELLASHSARIEPLDLGQMGGRYMRLIAGPFRDVAPARKTCEQLRAAGSFCQVAAFKGDPLD